MDGGGGLGSWRGADTDDKYGARGFAVHAMTSQWLPMHRHTDAYAWSSDVLPILLVRPYDVLDRPFGKYMRARLMGSFEEADAFKP